LLLQEELICVALYAGQIIAEFNAVILCLL